MSAKEKTNEYLCPCCFSIISTEKNHAGCPYSEIGDIASKKIYPAIISTSTSGKTSFLLSAIDLLTNLPTGLGEFSFESKSIANFPTQINKLKDGIPLAGTRVVPKYSPMWMINSKNSRKKTALFTLFDFPSIPLRDRKVSSLIKKDSIDRHIKSAGCFLFIIDPIHIKNISMRLSYKQREGLPELINSTGKELMERNIGYVRNILGSAEQLCKVPVAIILTKSDLFINDFSESPIFLENPYLSNGAFDIQDCNTVSEHVKDWLFEIGEGDLVKYSDKMCPYNKFFVSSATGGAIKQGQPLTYRPHRVVDPLLWILKERL